VKQTACPAITVGSMGWRLEVGTLKGIVTGIDLKLAQ
jgi:hypothetical protein